MYNALSITAGWGNRCVNQTELTEIETFAEEIAPRAAEERRRCMG